MIPTQLSMGLTPSLSQQFSQTANDMLNRQREVPNIVTFSQALDKLLGGGVHPSCLTEFCGIPGIGKTQVGMQLALDVQIPKVFGGVGGSAIYIDTEGSFMITRIKQMAEGVLAHLQELCTNPATPQAKKEAAAGLSVDSFLNNIHYYRVHDCIEQLALVHVLPSFIREQEKSTGTPVRLIVLDSVAFHFRHDFTDMAHRARLLQSFAQALQSMAAEFKLAVCVINQVTTKFKQNGQPFLAPALGDSWAHAVTHRIVLYMEAEQRLAFLYKSPSQANEIAPFRICGRGVRDIGKKRPRQEGQ
eukprot:TRINITY_DN67617_c7_g1_i2.p1 TRINITY_DN67617_c7_g1~~TRINITY_DN67617_c7_g1_i2.p1  ORF type:complete len:302 (+),score=33.39 TRINITY_DN67617_c7_g1_i2:311-1216(+)